MESKMITRKATFDGCGKDRFSRRHWAIYRHHDVLSTRFFCNNVSHIAEYHSSNIAEHRVIYN